MAPRSRAYWKGYLRLSLVSISVELYSATQSTSQLAFHQIHKPSGKRVRYEKTVPGIGPISTSDIVKGLEIDDDTYVIVESDEIDEIKLETKRTIDLVQFVKQDEIDPRYFERPYYLVPEGDVSTEGFVVIRNALESSKKIGLGQLALRGREHLVAVKPSGRGLLLETLRYQDELRDSAEFFDDIPDLKLDSEMVSLANELIHRKTKPFDAGVFKDSYELALRDLVERKRKGKSIVSTGPDEERRPSGQIIDLMEALKKSVGGQGTAKKPTDRKRAKGGAARRGA